MAKFQIVYSPESIEELKQLRRYDQVRIRDMIARHRGDRPSQESDPTIRKLDPAILAGYRLRIADYRVFYDVHEEDLRVHVIAIRYKGRQTLAEAARGSNS